MWQTIFLFIAVYIVLVTIISIVGSFISAIINKQQNDLTTDTILLATGLTYIIWYCN